MQFERVNSLVDEIREQVLLQGEPHRQIFPQNSPSMSIWNSVGVQYPVLSLKSTNYKKETTGLIVTAILVPRE